jgi:hypothetical protein
MKRNVIAVFIFISTRALAGDSTAVAYAESSTPPQPGFKKTIATGLVAGMLGLSLVWAFDEWWKDNAQPFHFLTEGWFTDYSLGIDKVGHAYTSYFYYHTFRNMMLWGGYEPDEATTWSAATTAFFALCVEIGDGLTTWGFSHEDLAANLLGLGYGVAQTKVPYLRNFNFKWSYWPDKSNQTALRFVRYYDAHTYWMTCNVHGVLPESMKSYWPEFLQVAVGYGVDDNQTRREFVIGLDFNLEVFPIDNPELHFVQKTVNMFHIPAPGVKFTTGKSPAYYLLHKN